MSIIISMECSRSGGEKVMVWMGMGMESVEWGKEELAFGTSRQNWIAIVRNGGSGSLSWSGESNKSKKRVTEFQPIIARRLSGLESGSQIRSKFHSIFLSSYFLCASRFPCPSHPSQ